MRLQKEQREKLLEWVAEGLLSDEINQRAAAYEPPFRVSRQLVDHYRDRTHTQIEAKVAEGADSALTTGLALKANRVAALQELAELMKKDIVTGPNLWVTDVKQVGEDQVEVERFNAAEVKEYRGVLDDIAKETGGRVAKTEIDATVTGDISVNIYIPDNGRARAN